MIDCAAGDAAGIIVAATITGLLGLPMAIDLVVEYAAGFGSSPAAAALLQGIKGIGPWTASVILLRGLGRIGAALVETGAIALAVYVIAVWSTRGRWTTDPGWHRIWNSSSRTCFREAVVDPSSKADGQAPPVLCRRSPQ